MTRDFTERLRRKALLGIQKAAYECNIHDRWVPLEHWFEFEGKKYVTSCWYKYTSASNSMDYDHIVCEENDAPRK